MTSILIKPVVVPAEILSLENANVSEKLTLALLAANPTISEWRVHLAVGIKHDGLRLLRKRLFHKGLLTERSGRHMVCVPGLVYREDPKGGHFVAESKADEIGQKVAPTEPTTVQSDGSILIPAEILHLREVGASEKFLLTVYAKNPNAQNALALRVLGISESGLKKLKGRLIQAGLLIRDGITHTIQVPGMVFVENSSGGYFIPEIEAIENGQIVAPTAKPVTSVIELVREWWHLVEQPQTPADTLRFITQQTIKGIETETSPGDQFREEALQRLKIYEDAFSAYAFVFRHLPRSEWATCKRVIATASPEQLAAFRERTEGMMLAGFAPRKMLGLFKNAIISTPPDSPQQ